MEGRKNEESYSFYFDWFVPILEKNNLQKELKDVILDEDLVCISSEAYGLLMLENHWNRWLDIFKKSKGQVCLKGGYKMNQVKSKIQPKYARGGLCNGRERGIGIGKGWSVKGIYCFNLLFQFVKKDRIKHPDFIKNWLKKKKQEIMLNEEEKRSQRRVESLGYVF